MKHTLSHYTTIAALMVTSAFSADIILIERTLVSSGNANFDLSVFPGEAGFNDRGAGGVEPGTPSITKAFGDGSIVDYNFFHSPDETIVSYAKGAASLIADATCPAENINGAGEDWANVWTITDPAGFTSTKDFNGTVPNTFARAAEVSGSIDIAGLTEGKIYFPHGTFLNAWTLTLTMSGPGQADIVVTDSEGNGAGTNFCWISEFAFNDAIDYNTISYTYSNSDTDGSRARFMGIVLDGSASASNEDSDGDFLPDLWEDANFGNNNGTIEPEDLTATDGTGDADADGATDRQELNAASDPNVKDSDNDGLDDGPEINTYGSDPNLDDTDGDTINDGVEVNTHGSDPTLADTDGDTLNDDEEVFDGVDGFVTSPILQDTDDDGVRDDVDTDPIDPANDNDEDGLSNADEKNIHLTDPLRADSDGDGILDGEEVIAGEDGFITLPLSADSDEDGFSDSQEILEGADPTNGSSFPGGTSIIGLLDRVLVSSNNANFDLSVFPGTASYNDRGVGGTEPGTPTFTNLFGDGTVLDYNFFHSPDETIASYAKGEANLIGDAVSDPANINGAGENWVNVWTATDPEDFTTLQDFTNGEVANTFARSAELSGTIDISSLNKGTLYVPHGTFINQWTLTMTMSGPGQEDIVAIDTQEANGAGTNFGWITSFSFVNTGAYDTITYHYTNADRDGSRARFMGVILAANLDPSPLRITDIEVVRSTGPDNIMATLTFNSKEGRTYSIYATSNLELPLESWSELDDGLPGAVGENSTTFAVNFNANGLPLADRQFFVVRENQ